MRGHIRKRYKNSWYVSVGLVPSPSGRPLLERSAPVLGPKARAADKVGSPGEPVGGRGVGLWAIVATHLTYDGA